MFQFDHNGPSHQENVFFTDASIAYSPFDIGHCMNLLTQDPILRHWLDRRNALKFEGELMERLVGLTRFESVFFVGMIESFNFDSRSEDELVMFLALHERHENALLFLSLAKKRSMLGDVNKH